jgi:hypothetical protein
MCLMWAVRATGPNDKFRAIGFEKMGFEKREPASAEPMCTEPLSAMAASAMATRDGDERDGGERNLVASVRSGHTCKREVTYTVCKMQVRAGGMLQRNQIAHAYRKLGCGFTHLT